MRNLEELKQQGRILLDEKRDEFVKQGLLSDEFFEMIQKNKVIILFLYHLQTFHAALGTIDLNFGSF